MLSVVVCLCTLNVIDDHEVTATLLVLSVVVCLFIVNVASEIVGLLFVFTAAVCFILNLLWLKLPLNSQLLLVVAVFSPSDFRQISLSEHC